MEDLGPLLSNTEHKYFTVNEIIALEKLSFYRERKSRAQQFSGVLCPPSEKDAPMNGQASNLLLATLSPVYRNALLTHLKPVVLPLRTVLYEPDEAPKYAHFITSGIASIVSSMSNGASAEVGLWGSEGLVESFHLLGKAKIPTRCFIQMEATALRMPFKDLQREFHQNEEFREAVLQCVQSQGFILGQLAACNRLHEAEERLARWLLMVRDRVDSDGYFLTQEFLATMLGARRTTVTAAAGELQRKGLIKYSRGHLKIIDSPGLENEACECYKTVRNLYVNFYSSDQEADSFGRLIAG
jgi:CRP-like cAMP-binding protein